jgi:hypothetical protein
MECNALKGLVENNEHVFGDKQTLEVVNLKLEAFEELRSNLKQLLLTEETRRGNILV